jgi:hypothetical protein
LNKNKRIRKLGGRRRAAEEEKIWKKGEKIRREGAAGGEKEG